MNMNTEYSLQIPRSNAGPIPSRSHCIVRITDISDYAERKITCIVKASQRLQRANTQFIFFEEARRRRIAFKKEKIDKMKATAIENIREVKNSVVDQYTNACPPDDDKNNRAFELKIAKIKSETRKSIGEMMVERARRFIDNGLFPYIPPEFPNHLRLLFKKCQGISTFQSFCSQTNSKHLAQIDAVLQANLSQGRADVERYVKEGRLSAAHAVLLRQAIVAAVTEFDYCCKQVVMCDSPDANAVSNWKLIIARVKGNFEKEDRHARQCASDLLAMFKTVGALLPSFDFKEQSPTNR